MIVQLFVLPRYFLSCIVLVIARPKVEKSRGETNSCARALVFMKYPGYM
jgi:hypothetical protein